MRHVGEGPDVFPKPAYCLTNDDFGVLVLVFVFCSGGKTDCKLDGLYECAPMKRLMLQTWPQSPKISCDDRQPTQAVSLMYAVCIT